VLLIRFDDAERGFASAASARRRYRPAHRFDPDADAGARLVLACARGDSVP
jgi:hypothetical protein